MSSSAMRQLEERHISIKVVQMVWSNKMDLLALSNVRGEVALHRLNWQRVWSLPPPSEGVLAKGMAWRPDSKVIAIAYSNNDVLLIDVENKELLHTSHVDGEVTCINWVQEKDSGEVVKAGNMVQGTEATGKYSIRDRSNKFLPKLPSLSRSFGSVSKCVEENLEDAKKIVDQTQLNILLVGVNTGKLYLSIFGLFPCGVVDMNAYISGKVNCILDADISEDFNMITVALSCMKEAESERQEELTLVLLDTPVLAARSAELHALALKHGHVVSLLGYLAHTINSITEAWENILLEMDSKLASYAATVPEGSVSADFLDLLMFGVPSDELELFLLQDLTEKGLKKLGHSIELSYSNIQKLVLKHLHSVGQSLVYHLAELRGMSRHKERFDVLGLQEETVDGSLTAAGAFLVKATEVQQVIDNSMKNYKAFFRWLYVVILRLTDERVPPEITRITQQDLAFIADFLSNFDGMRGSASEKETAPTTSTPSSGSSCKPRFNLERLGQYLVDQELTIPPETDASPWAQHLQQNPYLADHPTIIPHFQNFSLIQQHNHLKKAITEVFSQPEVSIGKQFRISEVIKCLEIPMSDAPVITHLNMITNNKLLLAFVDSPSPAEGFYLVEMTTERRQLENKISAKCAHFFFSQQAITKVQEGLKTDASFPMKVLDVQFYLPDVLSVLLEQHGEGRGAVFVQFPVRTALDVATPVPLKGKQLLHHIPRREASSLLEAGALRPIENMVASCFAVSGYRKVAVLLSESRRKVKLFEMEAEEEEEDEEAMETANATARDSSEASILEVSKGSEEDWQDKIATDELKEEMVNSTESIVE